MRNFKKLVISLVLVMTVFLSFASCGKTYEEPNKSEIEAVTSSEDIADNTDVYQLDGYRIHSSLFYGVASLRDYLKQCTDNEYAQQFVSEYDRSFPNDVSQLERDIVDFYACSTYRNKKKSSFDKQHTFWVIGYDEEGQVINGEEKLFQRTIISQYGDDSFMQLNIFLFDGKLEYSFGDTQKSSFFGFDVNTGSGEWDNQTGDECLWGMPYRQIALDEVNSIIDKHSDVLDMANFLYNDVYLVQKGIDDAKEREEQQIANREPEIGMSEEDVLNGKWGKPKKKNITKTANGTNEQWCYSNNRYVYFENGIVTGVSYSE